MAFHVPDTRPAVRMDVNVPAIRSPTIAPTNVVVTSQLQSRVLELFGYGFAERMRTSSSCGGIRYSAPVAVTTAISSTETVFVAAPPGSFHA